MIELLIIYYIILYDIIVSYLILHYATLYNVIQYNVILYNGNQASARMRTYSHTLISRFTYVGDTMILLEGAI